MKKTLFVYLSLILFQVVTAQNQLLIPPTLSGTDFQLTLQNGQFEFFTGHQTATMGVNGDILGPTLILQKGDNVQMHVTNNLGQQTTIHWHGMHLSSVNDGGPHTIIQPGTTWEPQFTVMNNASTMWYHPHLDEFTDEHVVKGIAGMIIIKDSQEAALDLPRTYGVDDIPLVVQTKHFDSNYQVVHLTNSDDVLMVNATINPYVDLPAQVVRLRLLNGSSQRVFNFGFSGNKAFYQIATDGGLLETPLQMTRLPLSPGERAEILVDLSGMENQSIQLMSYASEFGNGIYGATNPGMNSSMTLNGYNPNPMNGSDFNVLQINVTAPTANPVTGIPSQLTTIAPYVEANADDTRTFTLRPVSMGMNQLNGDFTINGVSFDMNTINVTIPLNNLEVWTVSNNSAIAHPFHVHDVQFQILSINGNTNIPDNAKGWQDTYLVPAGGGSMKIITKFEDFADDAIPYMYHCHMLNHEDGGMMGAFTVVDTSNYIDELQKSEAVLFPNPADGLYMTLQLRNSNDVIRSYSIINAAGQLVAHHKVDTNELSHLYSFPVFELPAGAYTIKAYTNNKIIVKRFIVK
jgi:bilirubin oxidase